MFSGYSKATGSPNNGITASLTISMAGSVTAIIEQTFSRLCCSACTMHYISGEEVKVSVGGDSCDGGEATVTGLVKKSRASLCCWRKQHPIWQV